ncbi:hypothetical protein G6702_01660 [Polynucleobacter paneuropaeus]|jgi:hypothetical protein|nr:hypothetical protein G6702_01660 [Polynucleobacter paneuropaeus]
MKIFDLKNTSQKLFLISATNVAIRAMGIVGSVAAIYVLSRALDASQFGMWSWLFSIATLITSQDLGVISAMRIELGKLGAKQDGDDLKNQQNQLLLSVIQGLQVMSTLVVLALVLASYGVVALHAIKAPYTLFAVVVVIACFSLFGTISANALLAFLKEDQVVLLDFCRNLMQLGSVACIYFLQVNLDLAVLIFFAPYALYSVVGLYLLLKVQQWSFVDFVFAFGNGFQKRCTDFLSLFKLGLPLWAIQLGAIVFSGSELIYVGFFTDDATIGTTAILQRYVNIAIGFTAASTIPFLGHYARRIHQNSSEDRLWLRQKSNLKLGAVLLIGLAYSMLLVSFGQQITEIWSGQIVENHILYLLIGAVFTVTAMNIIFQLFYQSNKVYVPVIAAMVFCGLIKLFGIYLLLNYFQMIGIWMSFLLGNMLFLFFNFFYVRKTLLKAED